MHQGRTKMSKKMLDEAPAVHESAIVRDSTLGRYTEIGARTTIFETEFGDYSYIVHDGSIIYASVGKFCSIAAFARINPGNHATWRASQHHYTYRSRQYGFELDDDSEFFEWRRSNKVVIGHDVWIGHGAVVMPGVEIGHGAVVGSSAVVTKDVAPYAMVAGVPARVIKRRHSEALAERLIALAWWDWDHETLGATLSDMRALSAEAFVEKYSG